MEKSKLDIADEVNLGGSMTTPKKRKTYKQPAKVAHFNHGLRNIPEAYRTAFKKLVEQLEAENIERGQQGKTLLPVPTFNAYIVQALADKLIKDGALTNK